MSLPRCPALHTIACLPGRHTSRIHLIRKRCFTDKPQTSPTRFEPEPSTAPVQNEFIHHTVVAFRNLGRVVAYVGYGTLIIGLVTATAFEGGHLWVERQMRITPDEDAKRWGWELEGWTGGEHGGTSPALGFFGRHAVRAAWFSLHNISPFGGATTISQAHGVHGVGNLNLAPSDLESARIYLEEAMVRVRDQNGLVRMDKVGSDLLERHAAVLERIGTRAALARAREDYIRIVNDGQEVDRFAQARLAVKIGDISERLGNADVALTWWTRGISLTSDINSSDISAPERNPSSSLSTRNSFMSLLWKWTHETSSEEHFPSIETKSSKFALPIRSPSSALAQRTLVAALLSISAHYSKTNKLKEAKLIQGYAISLIDAMVSTPEIPFATREPESAGQTLHHMYLLQRQSVLALHHAEVVYSLTSPSTIRKSSSITGPVKDLLRAASLSEVVAQVLTGTSSLLRDVPSAATPKPMSESSPKVAHPFASYAPLAPVYKDSPLLRGPARSTLRDARRTAMEAWDLCGVLHGEVGDGKMMAVECFERALGWAEEPDAERNFVGSTTVDAWQTLWERYMEARGRIRM